MSLLLIAPYAAIDRLWGSDARYGRLTSIGVLPAAGYLLGGHYGMATAAAFLVVRSLPFRLFGGSATPTTDRERIGLYLRYALMVPAGVILAGLFGADMLKAALAWGLWAAGATWVSSWYGRENAKAKASEYGIDPSLNVWVEVLRGALAGIAAGGL